MMVSATPVWRAAALRRLVLVALVASVVVGTGAPGMGRTPPMEHNRTLRGLFVLDRFHFPGYGRQLAVAVESLENDSPLHAAGVRPGDIITRLDNIRVTSLERLNRHYCWTTVRFFRPHDGNPWGNARKTCYNRQFHIPSRLCRCR